MNIIEDSDAGESEDDVASLVLRCYSPVVRGVCCVSCGLSEEQRRGEERSEARDRGDLAPACPESQWLAMPVFASSQCWQCPHSVPHHCHQ